MHSKMEKQGGGKKDPTVCMSAWTEEKTYNGRRPQRSGGGGEGGQKDRARKMRTKSEMTEPKTARRNIDLFHF